MSMIDRSPSDANNAAHFFVYIHMQVLRAYNSKMDLLLLSTFSILLQTILQWWNEQLMSNIVTAQQQP